MMSSFWAFGSPSLESRVLRLTFPIPRDSHNLVGPQRGRVTEGKIPQPLRCERTIRTERRRESMPRFPSFGIKRRLRRWAMGVLDRLTEPTAVLAKLYARDRSEPCESNGSRGEIAEETLSEDGGLPLPPHALTMAWNK